MNNKFISIELLVPIFNEEDSIKEFIVRCSKVLSSIKNIKYSFLFIDDGSTDNSLQKLLQLRRRNSKIKIINLSRNFGKEIALLCGIKNCFADILIPIDVDLQDPPELIPEMFNKYLQGYQVVLAERRSRVKDSFLKRLNSNLYFIVIYFLSRKVVPKNIGDFRLLSKAALNALKQYGESNLFMKGIFSLIGFKTAVIYYDRDERFSGKTKLSFFKLLSLALDSIFSFSSYPIKLIGFIGIFISTLSILFGIYIMYQKILYGINVPGYASLSTIILFFFGLNFIFLYFIGEYISRNFIESKKRPLYHIENKYGLD